METKWNETNETDWYEENGGTYKVRNEIETKRNQRKRNETKRNEINEINEMETKWNETNEIDWYEENGKKKRKDKTK
jgi:hypothetical protein